MAETAEPTPEQVTALLAKMQRELLALPVSERTNEREHAWLSSSELPKLREIIDEVRRHERDSNLEPGAKLSGRAALGMWASQLPGRPLTTYLSSQVQEALSACERSSTRLVGSFGTIADGQPVTAVGQCDDLALRPLAWDLMAATLQWTGREQGYTVTKLERVDDASDVWRAKVRVEGFDNLLTLWVNVDFGQLRIKLLDNEGKLYGVRSAAEIDPSALAGQWQLASPRAPSHGLDNTDEETREVVSVSIQGADVTVKHTIERRYFATSSGGLFRCNARREIDNGYDQSFSGKLEDGIIVATPKEGAKSIGRDAQACKWGYKPDAMATFKLVNGKLAMYRTDGSAYPEVVELERKPSDG
jgi:hypothetical protein